MKNLITLFLLIWTVQLAIAQKPSSTESNGTWTEITDINIQKSKNEIKHLPEKYRLLALNLDIAETIMESAPIQDFNKQSTSSTRLQVPMPDGSFQNFIIEEASVMHPDLAKKFPQIKSYSGKGVEDEHARIFFGYSQLGFNALILSENNDAVIIESVSKYDPEHYFVYYQKDFGEELVSCGVADIAGKPIVPNLNTSAKAGDCQLRVLRLAIPTSAEFTAVSITPTDPTGVNNTMAIINNMVTTINGVFQIELGIQLQLVANNNALIFTNAGTDGFTDGNQNAMASENQGIVDGIIMSGNYDISHAFGTNPPVNSGNGSAGVSLNIGNACNNATKAQGATIFGSIPPTPGITTLIMHELGHQLGANHTFNEAALPICTNPGQLSAATAFEPGSGSTIMSYDGTCGASNVQGFRDRYFHAISLQEIGNYITGQGACGSPTNTGNNQPTVNAGADFTVPVSTPFMLTATGNDADGDPITYCWEQMDNDLISHPPATTATNGPVFRTFPPVANATRWFPNLAALSTATATPWEVLPSISRTMNFRVTIRDNAVANGCTNEDDMVITFDDTGGPFTVNDPTGTACLFAGEPTTVNWTVANTDMAPINCANVDIFLSTDGGLTFPITLLTDTPNDGTQDVMLPDVVTEQARIMVKGSDNIFFNISPGNFIIDCIDMLTVTDDPASGVYKARTSLETSGTVNVVGFAEFFAGMEIILNPGFTAQSGSDFLARIQPCDPCKISPMVTSFETVVPQRNITITNLDEEKSSELLMPMELEIFPNPFADLFTVTFEIQNPGEVQLYLIDITGRLVHLIFEAEELGSGLHKIEIDGSLLPNGLFDCRLVSRDGIQQAKLVKTSPR